MLADAARQVGDFSEGDLASRISNLEYSVVGSSSPQIEPILEDQAISGELLSAAFAVKKASAQIDVVIHAVGILFCLPEILDSDEVVTGLSIGAGQGQGDFDLETTTRIAEFKFIKWQKTGNAVRQKALFQDYVKLALTHSVKAKFIYLLDAHVALKFLRGKAKPARLLDRNRRLYDEFVSRFGDHYSTVGEFHRAYADEISVVDLAKAAPSIAGLLA